MIDFITTACYNNLTMKNKEAQKLGSLGGKSTAKKYGSKHYSEAGKKGMEKRWGNKTNEYQTENLTEGQIRYRKYKKTYIENRKKITPELYRKYMDNFFFSGLREKVLERDGYKCVICGMTNEEHIKKYGRIITIDHIDGNGRNHNIKNNNIDNLRTLCLSCHGKIDITRRKYRPVKNLQTIK